ncbi:MAG: terminase large subunit [Ignavibacteria bacterium]|nr:terminase large subunit [Ignavibacteria bacterium]
MIYYDELKYVIEKLPIPNGAGAGNPIKLIPWQDKILQECFGEKRYDTIYIEIPKKNGKTSLSSGLLVAEFAIDNEPGPEFYCCAGDKNQAGIVFSIASYMIRATPALKKRIQIVPSQKRFFWKTDHTRLFHALSSDVDKKHGFNPYFTIFDELHTFKKRDLYDVMNAGDIARENSFKVVITTAGNDMSTICGELHERAEKTIRGELPETDFKGYIFTVEDKEKWRDEEQWYIANPSLGDLFPISKLRKKYNDAFQKPIAEAMFKRLHLNIWQENKYQWVPVEWFDRSIVEKIERSKFAQGFAGLDLGFGGDTTSLSILKKIDDFFIFDTYIWITDAEAIRQEKMYGVSYPDWIRKKYVRRYGNEIPDYDILETEITQILRDNGIKICGYDRWKSHNLVGKLSRYFEMIGVAQGPKTMTMPIKILESLLSSEKINHLENPAVRQAFKDIYIKEDINGNVQTDKQKSFHKIDPVVSLLMALQIEETQPEKKPSIYEKRGML